MVLVACSFFAKQHIIVNHINNLLLTDEGAAYTAYDDAGTRNGSSAEQNFRNLKYGPGLEMNSMTGKGSSDDCSFTNSPYEHTENKYSQLCYPSFRSPSKTSTNNLTSTLEGPIYEQPAILMTASQVKAHMFMTQLIILIDHLLPTHRIKSILNCINLR